MAVEEALSKSVPGERRERLRRDIAERIAKGDFGDEDLDDPIGSVVRNPGPRDPRGEAGAAAVPEEPLSE